jgi:plasmid replication initiation protein
VARKVLECKHENTKARKTIESFFAQHSGRHIIGIYKILGRAMSKRPPPKGDQQPDMFCAFFADIPIRDQRDMMERPFFSLAKKPRHRPIEYEVGNVFVKVSPNKEHGIATIWDADVLIWAATQITEALDRGVEPSRILKFHPYNLLKAIRRSTGGKDYERLRAALDRLSGTFQQC